MDDERRKSKRYTIPELTGSLLFECTTDVLNVSLSGIAVSTPLALDDQRTYQLKVVFDERELDLDGRVIWCEASEDGRYRAGIEFYDIWTPDALGLLKIIQTKVLADLDTRLVRRFQSQRPGNVELRCNYDFLVKAISLSGMEIEIELWPAVNQIYGVELNLRDALIDVRCRIVNVRHDQAPGNPINHVGLEFHDLSPNTKERIAAFIDRELATSPSS